MVQASGERIPCVLDNQYVPTVNFSSVDKSKKKLLMIGWNGRKN